MCIGHPAVCPMHPPPTVFYTHTRLNKQSIQSQAKPNNFKHILKVFLHSHEDFSLSLERGYCWKCASYFDDTSWLHFFWSTPYWFQSLTIKSNHIKFYNLLLPHLTLLCWEPFTSSFRMYCIKINFQQSCSPYEVPFVHISHN